MTFRRALKRGLLHQDPFRLQEIAVLNLDGQDRRTRERISFSADDCRRLVNQLAGLNDPGATASQRTNHPRSLAVWEDAIKSIEHECRSQLNPDDRAYMESALLGTYAHEILERDRRWHAIRAEKREENLRANSPEIRIARLAARKAAHQKRLARKLQRDQELTRLGEARYGTDCSRQELFRRLHADQLLGGFWDSNEHGASRIS